MGFFDNLKETADTLKEKATDLAQSGVATSKRLAEIAKLKTANMAEEDTIKKAYIELGKLYYAEHVRRLPLPRRPLKPTMTVFLS